MNYELRIMNYELRITNYELRIMNYELRIMKININYYALFREQAGCSGEIVEIEGDHAAELFESLKTKHGFSMNRAHVRLAVNDAFVSWETPLSDGDQIVFIPPVAGG